MEHPARSCPLLPPCGDSSSGAGRVLPCRVHSGLSPNIVSTSAAAAAAPSLTVHAGPWHYVPPSWIGVTLKIREKKKVLDPQEGAGRGHGDQAVKKRRCWDAVWRVRRPLCSVMAAMYFFTFRTLSRRGCESGAVQSVKVGRAAVRPPPPPGTPSYPVFGLRPLSTLT